MKILVAGHNGLVGRAIVRALKQNGFDDLLMATRDELDLITQQDVHAFFRKEKPDIVFLAAAKVGGILANHTFPADYIYENLMIEANVIHAAYLSKVKRLIFLGSSCIYPKHCPQPIKENYLLSGLLEPTNQPYAIAKIAGVELCHSYNRQYGTYYLPLMPTNLYGPNDNFDINTSHVIPAIIRKIYEAKMAQQSEVVLWGTGQVFREFMYVDDLADACLFFLNMSDDCYTQLFHDANCKPLFNIGSAKDITIEKLAYLISNVLDFKGVIKWDSAKPDGAPRKLLDISRMNALGWSPKIDLTTGIVNTYEYFKQHYFSLESV